MIKSTNIAIVALQETMIKSDMPLHFGWRGNYVFTPGSGHGRGCITLMSSVITPTNVIHLNDRGHIFKIPHRSANLIIANLYAPTGNPTLRIAFFNEVKTIIHGIQELDDDIIIAGDLNTVFKDSDCKNRSFTNNEKQTSKRIEHIISGMSLVDAWNEIHDRTTHTWRKNKQSSRCRRSKNIVRMTGANAMLRYEKTTSESELILTWYYTLVVSQVIG